MVDYQPLSRYTHGIIPEQTKDLPSGMMLEHVDWPLLLLQGGMASIGSRVCQFHEFHTEGWIRLTLPNDRCRRFVIETVCEIMSFKDKAALSSLILDDGVGALLGGGLDHPGSRARAEGGKEVLEWLNELTARVAEATDGSSHTTEAALQGLLLTLPHIQPLPCEVPGDDDGVEHVHHVASGVAALMERHNAERIYSCGQQHQAAMTLQSSGPKYALICPSAGADSDGKDLASRYCWVIQD